MMSASAARYASAVTFCSQAVTRTLRRLTAVSTITEPDASIVPRVRVQCRPEDIDGVNDHMVCPNCGKARPKKIEVLIAMAASPPLFPAVNRTQP